MYILYIVVTLDFNYGAIHVSGVLLFLEKENTKPW
jgi:hypothetical protein